MSTEQNKTVVRRFVEQVLPSMDTAAVDEVFASPLAKLWKIGPSAARQS
jgi:hypothetical protein